IAHGYVRLLGNGEAARELVARAEATAGEQLDPRGRPDSTPYLAIADAWRLLGDLERMRATLRAGLLRVADIEHCTRLAQAWRGYVRYLGPTTDDVRACVDRARSLASSFADWMDIAATLHRFGDDSEGLLDCLRRAAALTQETVQLRAVGRALR